ncbi:thioredoxin domain-containing protein [bacterium]|nr:MAG: thioredoxin domain-containing protein [bacterium]
MNFPSAELIKQLPPDGGPEFNRLVFEKSPYLLQHARNPVDWYPWGEEAFEKARSENKPIFLSIGYATCHWCHVMEHESFEDSTVAAMMNETFVCIKVDREERPDIDNIYMAVTQAMTGHGGWPMTVIMTWDKKPFFTGTYFPKHSLGGRPGMMELVPAIADAWANRKDEVLKSANDITAAIQNRAASSNPVALSPSIFDSAFAMFRSQFDTQYAGFGSSPKFPTAHNLSFLLRYYKRTENADALRMAERTLKAMRNGGMYDQIGFGFHRYSTDAKWFLPHFEKMLYDQALIAMAYTDAYQVTQNPLYKKTVEEIFEYVLRDMTDPAGGFYSAEDADSEGEEGKFYLWTKAELETILGSSDAELFCKTFNVTAEGNYYEEATREFKGTNIPFLNKDTDVLAHEANFSEDEFKAKIESIRKKLFDVREKRIHPLKDDKILTDWNGLMIAALAKGAQVFDKPEYADAARRAADFILSTLRDPNGRLLKRYRQGAAGLPAHLDDYAFMVWGLLDLYETAFDVKYLESALELNKTMTEFYWDKENGGFYFTGSDAEKLITRPKEIYDGAIPSGNSIAALNLIRLSRITGKEEFAEMAEAIGNCFSENISKVPMVYAQFLMAYDFQTGPSYEIVIAGEEHDALSKEMLAALRSRFIPNKVILFRSSKSSSGLDGIAPFTKTQAMKNGKATAYVCRNFTCSAPTHDVSEMMDLLK